MFREKKKAVIAIIMCFFLTLTLAPQASFAVRAEGVDGQESQDAEIEAVASEVAESQDAEIEAVASEDAAAAETVDETPDWTEADAPYAEYIREALENGESIVGVENETEGVVEEEKYLDGNVSFPEVDLNVKKYGLWVGSKEVTSANCTDIKGDGTLVYDPDTYTLTMKSGYSHDGYCTIGNLEFLIYCEHDLNIRYTTKVYLNRYVSDETILCGIYVGANNLSIDTVDGMRYFYINMENGGTGEAVAGVIANKVTFPSKNYPIVDVKSETTNGGECYGYNINKLEMVNGRTYVSTNGTAFSNLNTAGDIVLGDYFNMYLACVRTNTDGKDVTDFPETIDSYLEYNKTHRNTADSYHNVNLRSTDYEEVYVSNLTSPMIGNTPDYSFSYKLQGIDRTFTSGQVSWVEKDASGNERTMKLTDKFRSGYKYSALINLKPGGYTGFRYVGSATERNGINTYTYQGNYCVNEEKYTNSSNADKNTSLAYTNEDKLELYIPWWDKEALADNVHVIYKTHVQTYGWQKYVSDGAVSGTSGLAKRLEGINIYLDGGEGVNIKYRTHVQTYGWMTWVGNGEMSGTSGEAKRLEAIQIVLTGENASAYDVYYRVHAQSYGWLGWAKNGESSGTAGYAKRLEAIQIVVVKKGGSFDKNMGNIKSNVTSCYVEKPGSAQPPAIDPDAPNIMYQAHVQSYGWQTWKYNGETAGTSGEAKRIEAVSVKISGAKESGHLYYRAYVQSYGWMNTVKDGEIAGTNGEGKRLEAIYFALSDELAQNYKVYYRVHVESYGWLDWACNGNPAGTMGLAKRIEAIQVVLVKKGDPAPGSTAKPLIQK